MVVERDTEPAQLPVVILETVATTALFAGASLERSAVITAQLAGITVSIDGGTAGTVMDGIGQGVIVGVVMNVQVAA